MALETDERIREEKERRGALLDKEVVITCDLTRQQSKTTRRHFPSPRLVPTGLRQLAVLQSTRLQEPKACRYVFGCCRLDSERTGVDRFIVVADRADESKLPAA